MLTTRHISKAPGVLVVSTGVVLRGALDNILAAAANLRRYRERLTPEDYAATVCDIEQSAQQIFGILAANVGITGSTKRRAG